MNIEKAIEILEFLERTSPEGYSEDEKPALKLGIEALKVVKEFRTGKYKTINSPLPGETE